MKTLKYLLRILVALTFLISAFAKLFSIDSFEIYIFSFELFSLSISYLLARLVIAFELGLALWMLLNFDSKLSYYTAFGLLVFFTIFLSILHFIGNEDNCNCFGEFVQMNPTQSIIKNFIIAVVLFFSRGCKAFKFKHKWFWRIFIGIAALSTVFIISPPDNWRYSSYSRNTSVNVDAFNQAKLDGLIESEVFQSEKILCFFSLKCEYCHKAAQKINILRRRGEFSDAEIIVIFGGEERPAEYWFEQTQLDCRNYYFISPSEFLRITNGEMPLILQLKEGEIIAKYSFRDIREQ